MPQPEEFEVTLEAPGNLVARFRNVLIQVRTGTMTMRMLDDIERSGRLMRAAAPHGRVGAVIIVEETADVPEASVRKRQRDVLRDMTAHSQTYLAGAICGGGVKTSLLRTLTRAITGGMERIYSARSPEDAVEWLADKLESLSAVELGRAVDRARELARDKSG